MHPETDARYAMKTPRSLLAPTPEAWMQASGLSWRNCGVPEVFGVAGNSIRLSVIYLVEAASLCCEFDRIRSQPVEPTLQKPFRRRFKIFCAGLRKCEFETRSWIAG